MMDIRKVIDNPARYMKYLKGEYKSRYKDSIFLKEVGSRVMYIDIDIYQLAEHDITISDFRSLLVKQFNPVTKHIECPICHKNLNSGHITLAIDHNHTTGKVRGVLCDNCNTGIGLFKENTAYMNQAIKYLENPPLINRALNYKTLSNRNKTAKQIKDNLYKEFPECSICKSNKRLALDHNHADNQVRGILCNKCNLGLGLLKDSKENINRAIIYLNSNNA
jgi:hypothetical protein